MQMIAEKNQIKSKELLFTLRQVISLLLGNRQAEIYFMGH